MKLDNLTELIELLTQLEDKEPDPRLEQGQVFTPHGDIVTL
jgi:hypothetical protein